MPLHRERIHYLLEVYISKQASTAEENELMDWILEAEEYSELKNYMLEIWNQHLSAKDLSYVNWDEMYSRVIQAPVVSLQPKARKMKWLRLTAAAAILIALLTGAYLYFNPAKQPAIATIPPKQNDIAPPSGNKAVLTLADGTKIELDSSGNGTIALQGNVRIIKQSNGEITYTGDAAKEISYNTLNVPRGSKPLGLTLSDGSQVWLNVGSSLTYPTAFTGKERKITITGEAYFEVAPLTLPTGQAGPKGGHGKVPFIVSVVSPLGDGRDMEIEVLGTHFNVNAYPDEEDVKTTLLEGSVKIKRGSDVQMLSPGDQARLTPDAITLKKNMDLSEVVAWKDGFFVFNNSDIKIIMRQVARWYDVEVDFEGKIPTEGFTGKVSRNVPFSKFIKVLELNDVNVKTEGRKIIITP